MISKDSFAKQAERYRKIQNIFMYLSVASLIGTYAPIFFFLDNFWKLITGIITGLVCMVIFFVLALHFQDKALNAKQNSLALLHYLAREEK